MAQYIQNQGVDIIMRDGIHGLYFRAHLTALAVLLCLTTGCTGIVNKDLRCDRNKQKQHNEALSVSLK